MDLKSKIKTKKFWVSVVCGVVLLVQLLGFKIDVPYIMEIVNAVCALGILVGVIAPTGEESHTADKEINTCENNSSDNAKKDI